MKKFNNTILQFSCKNVSEDVIKEISNLIIGKGDVRRQVLYALFCEGHVLLEDVPGVGKTMLAKRLPGILPDITFQEALEVTKIHSIAGNVEEDNPLILI